MCSSDLRPERCTLCALFMLPPGAGRPAKNILTEGLKPSPHAPGGSFCPARQTRFQRKHSFGWAGRMLTLGPGTNRRTAMSFSRPFTGLMPPLVLLMRLPLLRMLLFLLEQTLLQELLLKIVL